MRVLFLSNNPNLGSTARILQCWLRLGRSANLDGRVVLRQAGDFSRWLADNQFVHRVDPMPWLNRRWPFPALWHAWVTASWARRAGVDVIHCNEHDVYPFALLVRRFLPRPMVCHVRFRIGREFSEWAFGGKRRPDALLWTSRQQRDDCADAIAGIVPPELQHVVYLGLDLDDFGTLGAGRDETRRGWGFTPDEVVVATASPLRPRKRVEDFVKLVATLAKENPRVVGVLAGDAPPGDEPYREEVVRQIAATGLGRRFVWTGNLEPVEPLYHAADVVVSTSEYETFGNSVCEAMACARPVAAYRGGSVSEVLGDTGLVVETKDLDGLTRAVRQLIDDPSLRATLGRRGRERVLEKFNPAVGLRQIQELYHALVEGQAKR